jgi:hypothetical protein
VNVGAQSAPDNGWVAPQCRPGSEHHLRTLLINLRVVYDAAVNELLTRNRSQRESLWPAVIAVKRLGYFLIALSDHDRRQPIAKESLAQVAGSSMPWQVPWRLVGRQSSLNRYS